MMAKILRRNTETQRKGESGKLDFFSEPLSPTVSQGMTIHGGKTEISCFMGLIDRAHSLTSGSTPKIGPLFILIFHTSSSQGLLS